MSEKKITLCVLEIVINAVIEFLDSFRFLLSKIVTEHLKCTSNRNWLVYLKSMIFQICYIRVRGLAPGIHSFIECGLCQRLFLTWFRAANIRTKSLYLCLYLVVVVTRDKGTFQVATKKGKALVKG